MSVATAWLWIPVGVGLGTAFVRLARRGDASRERRIVAAGLVIASAVYVGSAVLVGSAADVLLALAGVVLFAVPARLGVRRGAGWLGAGWALHVVWDGGLHAVAPLAAPGWYALLCLGFDLLVAGAVLTREKRA